MSTAAVSTPKFSRELLVRCDSHKNALLLKPAEKKNRIISPVSKNGPRAGLLPRGGPRTPWQRGSQGWGRVTATTVGGSPPRQDPGEDPPLSRVTSVALSERTVDAFYLSKNDTLDVSGYGVVQDSHLRKLFHCCFAVFSDQGEERS